MAQFREVKMLEPFWKHLLKFVVSSPKHILFKILSMLFKFTSHLSSSWKFVTCFDEFTRQAMLCVLTPDPLRAASRCLASNKRDGRHSYVLPRSRVLNLTLLTAHQFLFKLDYSRTSGKLVMTRHLAHSICDFRRTFFSWFLYYSLWVHSSIVFVHLHEKGCHTSMFGRYLRFRLPSKNCCKSSGMSTTRWAARANNTSRRYGIRAKKKNR